MILKIFTFLATWCLCNARFRCRVSEFLIASFDAILHISEVHLMYILHKMSQMFSQLLSAFRLVTLQSSLFPGWLHMDHCFDSSQHTVCNCPQPNSRTPLFNFEKRVSYSLMLLNVANVHHDFTVLWYGQFENLSCCGTLENSCFTTAR